MKTVAVIAIIISTFAFAGVSAATTSNVGRHSTSVHKFGRLYVSPGEGHWLQSKTDDGSIVILEDGSVWQIDPLDQIDTALWLPMSEITVVETAGGYLLINTDDGEKAHASLLR